MIDFGTWEDFKLFVNRKSWAWNSLLGQEDENKLLGSFGAATSVTSGTSVDITGIPSWARFIVITIASISTNGTSSILLQIGDSSGIGTGSYRGNGSILGSAAIQTNQFTAGFGIVNTPAAGGDYNGIIVLSLHDQAGFTWGEAGNVSDGASATNYSSSGAKSLSGTLDRIRLTTVNGTDAFDGSGAINVLVH